MTTRTETDTFGPIEVAADRYWGAQAQRSLGTFKIGEEKMPRPLVRALGIVKLAGVLGILGGIVLIVVIALVFDALLVLLGRFTIAKGLS